MILVVALNPFRIKVWRQILTYKDIGIQMKLQELTKTFIWFQNEKNLFSLHGLNRNNSAL